MGGRLMQCPGERWSSQNAVNTNVKGWIGDMVESEMTWTFYMMEFGKKEKKKSKVMCEHQLGNISNLYNLQSS